jgi:hypothetical protein
MIKIKRKIDIVENERKKAKKIAAQELKKIIKLLKTAETLTETEISEILERKDYFENLFQEEEIIYYNGVPLSTGDPDVEYILDNPGKVGFMNAFDKEIRKHFIKSKRITKIDQWMKKNIKISIKKYLKDSLCPD